MAQTKRQVERLAGVRNITVTHETPAMDGDPIGQLTAPDGYGFPDGPNAVLHSLTFVSWTDALDLLNDPRATALTPCPDDCDCKF